MKNKDIYVAGAFKLDCSTKSKPILYYQDEIVEQGCDGIINIMLELDMLNYGVLNKIDVEDEEIVWLTKLLNKCVLNNNLCIRK